jgi:hypothetical protein
MSSCQASLLHLHLHLFLIAIGDKATDKDLDDIKSSLYTAQTAWKALIGVGVGVGVVSHLSPPPPPSLSLFITTPLPLLSPPFLPF